MDAMMRMALVVALSAYAAAQVSVPDDHPVRFDRTGIAWQLPFTKAAELAETSKHLLVIKPVAFGTTEEGCW
ncbi:MAG: hypothetical protein ACI89X_001422 [Planctomycetota bacterium]|jgi:hypothetical protein